MGIGHELREARRRAGLSPEQIAERTKVKLEKIQALEQEAFESLPRGIYLDGIVRAYAQEVGLDPAGSVAQLHAETIPTADHIIAAASPPPPHSTALIGTDESDTLDFFPTEGDAQPLYDAPLYDTAVGEPATFEADPDVRPEVEAHRHTSVRLSPGRRRSMSRGAMYVVAALLAAFGVGMYLHSITRGIPEFRRDQAPASAKPAAVPDSSDVVAAPEPVTPSRAEPSLDRASGAAVGTDERENAAAANRSRALDNTNRPVEDAPARAIARDAAHDARPAARAASRDLTGAWNATTRVDSTAVTRYKGLRLGYRLQLQQNGNRVTGTGFKATENGRSLPPRGRTPIALEGTTDGREVLLTFTEKGLRRTSKGRFALTMANDGTLSGSFDSDAARSRGTIEARRQR